MRPYGWCACVMVLWLQAQSAIAGTVLVVGDSISAGFGLNTDQGWVTLLKDRLTAEKSTYAVVNASISGDTSAGGLSRLPTLLTKHTPEVVVIELGGNDGLRGMPIAQLKQNLSRMVRLSLEANSKVLILGIRLPPNYGQRYTTAFAGVFPKVAQEFEVPVVPFLLEGAGGVASMMQADGIHPNAQAQPTILENVWPTLEPMLTE
ncbi:arylesterase [Pseudomonas matsuisoli]|uniref:Arylesterase n=2 Tax=Pseudomonas matsuisoli TaxID=1515666 RepID=A0A917Q1K4_9PSED|nr:arylesterase [Pseudomonas matsuisoli]GGK05661.1 arylesterase [Pseudomonas matsuisoli]